MKRMTALCFLLVAMLPAACAARQAVAVPADVTFVSRAPIQLDVSSVAVDQRYRNSSTPPFVEGTHQVTPSGIAERWTNARLVAVGNRGIATLTVMDGRVTQESLAVKGGLTGLFGDQNDTRLTAHLKARLTVSVPGSSGASANYEANVEARAERTILQSASLNDRDAAYMALMNALAEQFDATLTGEISKNMAPVIR